MSALSPCSNRQPRSKSIPPRRKPPPRVATADVVHSHALITLAALVAYLTVKRAELNSSRCVSWVKPVVLALTFHLIFRSMVESPTTVQLVGRLVRNWTQRLRSFWAECTVAENIR